MRLRLVKGMICIIAGAGAVAGVPHEESVLLRPPPSGRQLLESVRLAVSGDEACKKENKP